MAIHTGKETTSFSPIKVSAADPRRRGKWLSRVGGVAAVLAVMVACSADGGSQSSNPVACQRTEAGKVALHVTVGTDSWTTIIDGTESLTRVELGGQLLYSVHATREQDHVLVHEEIGAAFGGQHQIDLSGTDRAVSGNFDGRALVAFDPHNHGTFAFADGGSAPTFPELPASTADALSRLRAEAQKASDTCLVVSEDGTNAQFGSPGVIESPQTSIGCRGCHGICAATLVGCEIGALLGCSPLLAIPIFGPGLYVLCVGTATILCLLTAAACGALCNAGGEACCSVPCKQGPGGFNASGLCCKAGDTCLDPKFGTCCVAGTTACLNKQCCDNATEVCAPSTGGCCGAANTVCGTSCCGVKDACAPLGQGGGDANNPCCPVANPICNNECCQVGETCSSAGQEGGSATNFCCAKNHVVCNDVCCKTGEDCIAGGPGQLPHCGLCKADPTTPGSGECPDGPPHTCCNAAAGFPGTNCSTIGLKANCCLPKTICNTGSMPCCGGNQTCTGEGALSTLKGTCCADNQVCGDAEDCCTDVINPCSIGHNQTHLCCDTSKHKFCNVSGRCCDDPLAPNCDALGQCVP